MILWRLAAKQLVNDIRISSPPPSVRYRIVSRWLRTSVRAGRVSRRELPEE
jgi:hypothetical protein